MSIQKLIEQKKADEAIPLLQSELESNILWAQGWVWLGDCFLWNKQGTAATMAYERAWILDPQANWVEGVYQILETTPNGSIPKWLSELLKVPKVKVTGAMIAKNAASTIGKALAALQPAVDELVVVDTGSEDSTMAIAESFGAKIVVHPWKDDFAAARNAALPHCEMDWVLWVDADEYLDSADISVPRIIAGLYDQVQPAHWARIVQVNHMEDHVEPNYDLIRFFPLRRGVGWRWRIHEQVDWLHEEDRHQEAIRPASRIRVHHWGYMPDVMNQEKKTQRNIKILREEVKDHPASTGVRWFLGRDLYVSNQLEEAVEVLKQAEQLAVNEPSFHRTPEIRYIMSEALMRMERWDEAEQTAKKLTELNPEYPGGWYIYAKILLEVAVRKLHLADQNFIKVHDTSVGYTTLSMNPQVTELLPIIGRADIARFQSRLRDAIFLYKEALKMAPDHEGVKDQLWRIKNEISTVSNMLGELDDNQQKD